MLPEIERPVDLNLSLNARPARITDQPPPQPTDGPAIVDLVQADLADRKQTGIQRYGTPLQAHNGRNALVDAYQEALDLAIYLRQAIEERAPDLTMLDAGAPSTIEPTQKGANQ